MTGYELRPVGRVVSLLVDPADAPRQGEEGAPDADLVFDANVADGLREPRMGGEVLVLTWLHDSRPDTAGWAPGEGSHRRSSSSCSVRCSTTLTVSVERCG